MKNIHFILSTLVISIFTFTSCKKDNPQNNSKQQLVIENGATTVEPDASITYSAVLVDEEGNRTAATEVTWSSSDENIATISTNGQVTIAQVGVSTIQASVTIDGTTLTASAPLNIQVPGLFAVAPSAVLVDTEFPDIEMEAIYLGTGNPTYNYQSSNSSVATVSSNGVLSFTGAGSCEITITANGLDGNPSVTVPVTVLGTPTINLPVARVVVSPSSHQILKTEVAQYIAKAYNVDNQEVNTTFSWSVMDTEIANIDASGNITPLKVGTTKVIAIADGIAGEAELIVAPNKVILVEPYYASVAAGQTQQFSANQYDVVRSNGALTLTNMTVANNVNWSIPTYGFSMFDIATVDNNGLVTVKSNASPGLLTFVIAEDSNDDEVQVGVGTIAVALATNCNCGTQNAAASAINLTSSNNVTLSFGQTAQIQATVVDAFGNAVSGANLSYCSDNVQVADVDFNGEITPTALLGGTTTITVCHGNLSETITVNVQ